MRDFGEINNIYIYNQPSFLLYVTGAFSRFDDAIALRYVTFAVMHSRDINTQWRGEDGETD